MVVCVVDVLQGMKSELQRLVELRLLLLELSERISLKLLKVSSLPVEGINQVFHCVAKALHCSEVIVQPMSAVFTVYHI